MNEFNKYTAPVVASYPVQNLLLWSEDCTNAVWVKGDNTITLASGNDVAGNNTLNLVTTTAFTGGEEVTQLVTGLTASTTYYFSWDVKRGTKTDCAYKIYNWSGFNDIIAQTSYYTSTSATVSRFQVSFTTPVGCTQVKLSIVSPQFNAGTMYVGRMQLATTSTATYGTTTTTIIP